MIPLLPPPCLTKEQQDRLAKLDEEIATKQAYEEKNRERKLASSRRTGIPYNLVDSDVVRIGTLLGLVKSLDALEGRTKEEKFSILDLFLDNLSSSQSTTNDNYSKIPPYFSPTPNRITEAKRIDMHRSFISLQCTKFCSFVSEMLRQEMNDIDAHLCITLPNLTIETFVNVVKVNSTIVLDALKDENDDELWEQLYVLRNSLIGCMNICEYKNFVIDQIATLVKWGKLDIQILKNLSFLDANLSLYPGFQTVRSVPSETYKIQRELVVRNHMKDPELKAFDLKTIIKECCVPSLMFVDLSEILANGIVGPYRNNSISYINSGYYALKSIIDGIRLWILDEELTIFSERLRSEILSYTVKLLYTHWRESYKSKNQVTEYLLKNVKLLCKPHDFRSSICYLVKTQSQWYATELDVFDSFPDKQHSIQLATLIDLPECIRTIEKEMILQSMANNQRPTINDGTTTS